MCCQAAVRTRSCVYVRFHICVYVRKRHLDMLSTRVHVYTCIMHGHVCEHLHLWHMGVKVHLSVCPCLTVTVRPEITWPLSAPLVSRQVPPLLSPLHAGFLLASFPSLEGADYLPPQGASTCPSLRSVLLPEALDLFFFFLRFYLFLRQRQSMNGGGAEREGDTESEAGSRL